MDRKTQIARWAAWTQRQPMRWGRGSRMLAYVSPIALLLAACASGGTTQTTVAEAEVALTAAEQVALSYVTLPACPAPSGPLCSDAATSAKIKQAAQVAYAAVKAAEASGTSADLAAANAAIATLTALVPAVK